MADRHSRLFAALLAAGLLLTCAPVRAEAVEMSEAVDAGLAAAESEALPLPVPRAALADPLDDDPVAATDPATVSLGEAWLGGPASAPGAQAPLPLGVIREGFAESGTPEASFAGAVGLRLGSDEVSVSTRLSAPGGTTVSPEARLGWQVSQPLTGSDSPLFIHLSATGGTGPAATVEQGGEMIVGYRHELLRHLALIPRMSAGGRHVFAPGEPVRSSLTPELKLSADLAALAALPWQSSFDLALSRKLPLMAETAETRGSAMFRIRYALE